MKKIFYFFCLFILNTYLTAQNPDKAFNPMTAAGAKRISIYNHILYWQNPSGITCNEIYISDDSTHVAGLNPTVKLLSGYPDIVYNSMALSLMDTIINGTWYYWRVVEHNQNGSSVGDIWKFRTVGYHPYDGIDLTSGLNDWIIQDSSGYVNWIVDPNALIFNPFSFYGNSLIIYKKIFNYIFGELVFSTFYHHFFTGPFIGAGYTSDEGNTWNSLWEIRPNGNFSSNISFQLPKEEVQIGFYFKGSSDGVLLWEISNININSIIYLLTPPNQLIVNADTDSQKVKLSWSPGQFTWPDTILSYRIERKEGLPNSANNFTLIAEVAPHILNYNDTNVSLGSIYTYRISTTAGNYESNFSNDATAYVPTIVSVELVSFTAEFMDDKVKLNWTTGTETNNSGYEIQRKLTVDSWQSADSKWDKIGYVSGSGTTTEPKYYSFTDENVSAGIYKYRLKQIDYDGSFTYSEEVEIEVNILPEEFILYQNYPNPFNPVTKIKYVIPGVETRHASSLLVTLKIYDVLGKEIAILVNEEKQPGIYEVEFDATELSSGIYFYTLKTSEFNQTRKMILAK